ncbi:MAG TPA: DUF3604 domain-containing protein [Myxococcota bacterium]|nr:DUF3604 domain-containing protein [Myxococcota bacterium]
MGGCALARLAAAAALAFWATAAGAADEAPCANRDPLRRPYFGDLHVHTALSQDASTQGTRNGPDEAYRFARGGEIGLQPYRGDEPLRRLRLARPLDFAAVTDHAEQLGEVAICRDPALVGNDAWVCRLYRNFPRAAFFVMNTKATAFANPTRFAFCGESGIGCLDAARSVWDEIREAAEAAYDRSPECRFTSFVGYEWTGATGTRNLHRNVVFRGGVVPALPVSYFEATTPQALWRALRRECLDAGSGCDALTIPHNSNLSGGLMFLPLEEGGRPLGPDGARERAFFEPLVEVMQHKGDSECLPGVGTPDELCAYEKLPYDSFGGKYFAPLANPPRANDTVRGALLEGLAQEARLGANPFRYGLIASTDTHLGAAGAVDERRHPGHGGAGAPAGESLPVGFTDDLEFNPGGLAVLWAEENRRDALFDAMRRREAYGTSGPRLVVRFFGGYGLRDDLCEVGDFAAQGYAGGVPMGGILPAPPEGSSASPAFAVWALRDAGTAERPGTPLQRVQIVKGWLDRGVPRERVLDVAGDAANGADVERATCEPRGPGFDQLCRVWRDPDFDPRQPAVYYARVVENPTCRWSAWQCVDAGVDCARPETIAAGFEACCAAGHAWRQQERAWTSPIWVSPAAGVPEASP